MKYLGMWIDETFNSRVHVATRIKAFIFGYQNLKRCGITSDDVTSDIKLCFYKTYIRPTLCNGLDNVILNKTQIKKKQTLESKLIKGMFRLRKRTKSTQFLRAVNINKVDELIVNTKVKFLIRLVEFELTKSIIHELMAHDPDLSKDNKSLLYEISVITNRQTIYEMIKYGNEIVRQTVRRILKCRKDDEVIDIMEALEIEGENRRIRLNQLLHIEY
ncbi:hypothetical protein BpHYR1_054239 [Brachionus plicatilis]|uniref:RNA-directed DNA polymerase from mobile element jockey-like n=1 Tax=Brachionus plicatilis TaxID=10195 RepID=A0A3M7RNA1_BRAPC|nr:hypothetical protein BpHYR1_054239 [Brachionus plicatilis]